MNRKDFNEFMDKMSKYPWITQNFQKIILIPATFINIDDLEAVKTQEDIKGLMTLKNEKLSNEWELKELRVPFEKLQKKQGLS